MADGILDFFHFLIHHLRNILLLGSNPCRGAHGLLGPGAGRRHDDINVNNAARRVEMEGGGSIRIEGAIQWKAARLRKVRDREVERGEEGRGKGRRRAGRAAEAQSGGSKTHARARELLRNPSDRPCVYRYRDSMVRYGTGRYDVIEGAHMRNSLSLFIYSLRPGLAGTTT